MVEGRAALEWAQTSTLCALLWNVNAPPDNQKTPDDFNPWARRGTERADPVIPGNDITILKALLPPKNPARVHYGQ